ncbi:hypothetical protein MJO29_011243 [Puccinia striiformis f. sp. tritici]|nr:hypothetical protein MJO29_011243 [Puccinia striiformis f. sp. tritici]
MSDPDSSPHLEHEKQSTIEPASITPTEKASDASKKPGRFDKTFESEEKPVHALVDMSQIQLKAEDLYDKDKVDLEQVELDDVWALLQCTEEGLTETEAQRRLEIFGPNKLETVEINPFLQFLGFMWNPLSWVMEAAAIVAIALSNGEGEPPDWQDFVGIVLLLLINSAIGFYEERSAGNAVAALMDSLAPKAKVRRDGSWKEIESSQLVPGDIVAFKIGDVVPADNRLYDAINVSIDQAALTGESLPATKKVGDQCFSGSTCKQGEAEGVVIATGANTFFGRAAALVGADDDSSGHLQKILAQIGTFCLVSIGIFIIIEVENQLEADVEEFARRGLRALAVAFEDVPSNDQEAPGNGFELVGLLAIFDPPREDTKQTIDDAMLLGVRVKMVTGDQLAIAKETGRRLGLGDHMYPAKVLKDGPEPGGKHLTLDEMILDADGFAGVFPEHKYEIVKRLQGLGHLCAMTGDGANDAPALSRANVGIAVEGATDAARGAADIVLTEPGLSTIVHAIRQSRIIFQRMRNYSIYACAVTIRIVVGFAVLVFAYKFDFPPFMVLIIALLNDGTIMTLSVDRVLPSMTPDHWDLTEIFIFATFYGLYLALSTIILVVVIRESNFFPDRFGVETIGDINDFKLHMIIYLQVAQISQALIFITRSHGFFFMERPSFALMGAFCLAQLISSIIAAYGNWGFTQVEGISGGWIGIVWIWNIIWFLPMDFIKFGVKYGIRAWNAKRGVKPQSIKQIDEATGIPLTRTASRHESLYSNHATWINRAQRRVGLKKGTTINPTELHRVSSHQARATGAALRHSTSVA